MSIPHYNAFPQLQRLFRPLLYMGSDFIKSFLGKSYIKRNFAIVLRSVEKPLFNMSIHSSYTFLGHFCYGYVCVMALLKFPILTVFASYGQSPENFLDRENQAMLHELWLPCPIKLLRHICLSRTGTKT